MAEIQYLRLRAASAEDLREFLRTHDVDMECGGMKRHPDGTVSIEIFVPDDTREELESERWSLEVLGNATQTGLERQREVGKGNRFAGARSVPQGFGIKR